MYFPNGKDSRLGFFIVIEEINENFINLDKWLNISFTEKYYSRQIN